MNYKSRVFISSIKISFLFLLIYYLSIRFFSLLSSYSDIQTKILRSFLIASFIIFIPGVPIVLNYIDENTDEDKSTFYEILILSSTLLAVTAVIGMLSIYYRYTLSFAGGIFFDPGHTLNSYNPDGVMWFFIYCTAWIPYAYGFIKLDSNKKTLLKKIGLLFVFSLLILVIFIYLFLGYGYITAP